MPTPPPGGFAAGLSTGGEAKPYTVTELANEIRRELRPLTALLLKGEVSGMKQGSKGHYSFVIRDSQSLINAFIYADDARRVTTLPEDGQVFIFRGRVDYWTQYGSLRFIVDQVEFDDVGKLRARLEELKRRLESQGAFAPERKRKLPFLPRSVAILTSPTGAVIHDLQETIWDRYPNMGIVVYPVQVQGAGAPMSVARALRRCNQERRADVIVLARGGGSFEEMYAFNTELVARAILDSRLPVVTALGHTSDAGRTARTQAAAGAGDQPPVQPRSRQAEPSAGRHRKAQPAATAGATRAGRARAAAPHARRPQAAAERRPGQPHCDRRPRTHPAPARESLRRPGAPAREPAPAPRGVES